MLRSLERIFKRLLAAVLRFLFTSPQTADICSRAFHRILVVRQHNQLGDMLCVVPLLRALRERFPDAFIGLMTSPVNHDVMLNNRYLNQVIKYDKAMLKGRLGYSPVRIGSFIKSLRNHEFDLVLVPATVSVSFTSDLLAFLSGARTRIGVGSIDGIDNPSSFLFTHPVELDWRSTPHRHQTVRNIDIARPLGINASRLDIQMSLTESELNDANLLWLKEKKDKGAIIGFHPGAGKPPNRWPAKRFAVAADVLARELGATILITAGPMDDEPVQELISAMSSPFELVSGKAIREIALILSFAHLVVSNDTGIMHVAAAVGTPVLSLFGPTDPNQWAPIGDMHRFIQGKDGRIDSISVDEVIATARAMLASPQGNGSKIVVG